MERIIETTITSNCNDCRIDSFLSGRFTYLSRTEWQNEIVLGKIYLNNKMIISSHKRVHTGDKVSYNGRGIQEPEIDANFSIVYEDDFLIGISKSGNLPVHPSGRYFNNTLINLLSRSYNFKLYPVHRIDRETSGIIILAKSSEIASRIQKNFKNVKKKYIAIIHGNMDEKEVIINIPIGVDKNSEIRKKRKAHPDASENAYTRVKRIFCFNNYTLISVYPETGRLHQIRIHLNYSGYPIVGDKLYGLDEKMYLEFINNGFSEKILNRLKFHRSALHSRMFRFMHPVTKEEITIKSRVPDDLREFIRKETTNV